ncbi:MAG TPA: glycine cleavage system protein H [Spirochaetota bacterium]|nr:glycine cleavage system protein H [Spirochaetota bacterium]HPC41829.1 glycine cleavage system protein H [Spirochaetota bacterium]HPL17678.1 glycine cleavage system protein H [Spirochaetota bacterium]HQF07550.1 glycine cleavage system protein H [Spirochaetota bacterium]HQH96281.1 glycine cleavage system protein H [Spirochaetota bacterium]
MKTVPEERMFDRSHGWIEMEDEFIGRCGISAQYLAKLDIVEFIAFPDIDDEIKKGAEVALLESGIDYYKYRSPVSGRVTDINQKLENQPGLINDDPYGEGWIYKIDVKEPREFDELMHEDEYNAHLERGGDI